MNDRLWQLAVSFAARAHRSQLRKDGVTPYAAHPFRVAMTLRHVFGCDDAEALAAALLHDTIEDAGVDYDELAEEFGATIADLVAALTKNSALPERAREADYDRRLAAADWRARLVKLADVYDNLCDGKGQAADASARLLERARRALVLAATDTADSSARARRAVGRLLDLPPP